MERSEGQKNRRVREAYDALRWLYNTYALEEFVKDEVIEDRTPIDEMYSSSEIAVFSTREERLEAAFRWLTESGYVEVTGDKY